EDAPPGRLAEGVDGDHDGGRGGTGDGRGHRGVKGLAVHTVVLALGLCSAFHPTLFSGFARVQTDPGDTLLNHYILEHSWRWLTQPDYAGTLWSPPFFAPTPLTLAYSENLLGTAPLYWLLRTLCPELLAFQLWVMLVSALTFADPGTLPRLAGYFRARWRRAVPLLLLAAGLTAALALPYREANRGFIRSYAECSCLLPNLRAWVTPPPDTLGWGTLSRINP